MTLTEEEAQWYVNQRRERDSAIHHAIEFIEELHTSGRPFTLRIDAPLRTYNGVDVSSFGDRNELEVRVPEVAPR